MSLNKSCKIKFESFEDCSNLLKAYISENNFSRTNFDSVYLKYDFLFKNFKIIKHPYKN